MLQEKKKTYSIQCMWSSFRFLLNINTQNPIIKDRFRLYHIYLKKNPKSKMIYTLLCTLSLGIYHTIYKHSSNLSIKDTFSTPAQFDR